MKRTLVTMMASSMLVFGVPAAASAHGKHHHGARHANTHKRHARRARLMTFAPASGAPTTSATSSTEPAGTVTSFTGGVLTITLTDKSVVSGKVTDDTEIHCQSATPPSTTHGDDQGGGDDQNGGANGEHGGPSASGMEHRNVQAHESQNDGDDEGGQESCTEAALVPEAKVLEAQLSVSSAGAVWKSVDLIK